MTQNNALEALERLWSRAHFDLCDLKQEMYNKDDAFKDAQTIRKALEPCKTGGDIPYSHQIEKGKPEFMPSNIHAGFMKNGRTYWTGVPAIGEEHNFAEYKKQTQKTLQDSGVEELLEKVNQYEAALDYYKKLDELAGVNNKVAERALQQEDK